MGPMAGPPNRAREHRTPRVEFAADRRTKCGARVQWGGVMGGRESREGNRRRGNRGGSRKGVKRGGERGRGGELGIKGQGGREFVSFLSPTAHPHTRSSSPNASLAPRCSVHQTPLDGCSAWAPFLLPPPATWQLGEGLGARQRESPRGTTWHPEAPRPLL